MERLAHPYPHSHTYSHSHTYTHSSTHRHTHLHTLVYTHNTCQLKQDHGAEEPLAFCRPQGGLDLAADSLFSLKLEFLCCCSWVGGDQGPTSGCGSWRPLE